MTFWTFTVTLTLNAVILLKKINFYSDALAYDDLPSNQVWLQKDQQCRDYSRFCHILIIWDCAVTLTLKKYKPIFWRGRGSQVSQGTELSSLKSEKWFNLFMLESSGVLPLVHVACERNVCYGMLGEQVWICTQWMKVIFWTMRDNGETGFKTASPPYHWTGEKYHDSKVSTYH